MRTTGRGGQLLNAGYIDAALANDRINTQWQISVVDMVGDSTVKANWIYHAVPQEALLDRSRKFSLDEGPMQCTLSLIADKLPSTLPLKQYHRIEIDRCYGDGANGEYPYFTGLIEEIEENYEKQDDAIVHAYKLSCAGVLQVAKRRRINALAINPVTVQKNSNRAMIVLMRVRIRRDNAAGTGASNAEYVPSGLTYAIDDATDGVAIDNNSDFSSPYTRSGGSPDYTLDVTVEPAKITWNNLPANTRYYRFYVPVYAGIPIWDTVAGATVPAFFKCPYGRNPFDLYWTQVSSYTTSGGNGIITPKDPTAFKSGNNLLDVTTGEYLIITDSDGTEDAKKISSVDVNGVITLNGLPTFTPAAGDPIRLATLEMYPAFDEVGHVYSSDLYNPPRIFLKSGATINEGAPFAAGDGQMTVTDDTPFRFGQFLLVESELMRIAAWYAGPGLGVVRGQEDTTDAQHPDLTAIYGEMKRGSVAVNAAQAIFTFRGKRNFVSTDEAKVRVSVVTQVVGNRVERAIKSILTTLELFDTTDITEGTSGAFIKSVNLFDSSLEKVLQEFKEASLPPNAYITDERDGKVTIKGYTQGTIPDMHLKGIGSIQVVAASEPPTQVVVIGVSPEVNKAPEWFSTEKSSGFDNIANTMDGDPDTFALQTDVGAPGLLRFALPDLVPLEVFPLIDRIELIGYGYFSVYVEYSTTDRLFLRDWQYKPVGVKDGTHETVTITGGELAATLTDVVTISGNPQGNVVIKAYAVDDSATRSVGPLKASVKEVRILVKKQAVHAAKLTDDNATDATYGAAPSGWLPTDVESFGTFYWQPTPLEQISYRFAPTSHLKRVLPNYDSTGTNPPVKARANQRHKTEILELPGIALHECRDYAERYLDEFTKRTMQYHVRALLDDRVERGDTVVVLFPDGTAKNLFVLGVADSGSREDAMAEYHLVDYS